jgi:N-acetylglucosamine-6-phosphate deacetylase
MTTQRISGIIVTPDGFIDGELTISDARIVALRGRPVREQQVRASNRALIVPGFVDLHVHGGGGSDMMDGGVACETIARMHASHGTTSLLATTLTAPKEDLIGAFDALAEVMRKQKSDRAFGSRILGVHLEGPYISDSKLGAQPAFARDFDDDELQMLHAKAPIKLITLAPELTNSVEIIQALTAYGFVVQLGHSEASYEQARDGFDAGARGVTHLFNAMSGMHHRAPGLVGAALAHARYAEIIPDLLHVHEGAVRAAMRAIPCVYCVTDSTAAAGMPDGEYRLGRQTVSKCMGGVRLPDGTLAGSTLTMDEAFRNLVDVLGLELQSAVRRTSTYACDFLNIAARGRIAEGAFADLAVLDRDLKLQDVFVEGVRQDRL